MSKTKNTIKIFDQFAKRYQEKFMDMDLYLPSYDMFCSFVEKENAEILELACGPGNITKYLLSKRPDFKILGSDLSSKMIELAKTNNPEAEFQVMDCRDIGQMDEKYDAILCGFGLPYLSKEEALKLIADASTLLNPHGVLYLSTMEDDYSKSGFQGASFGGEDQLFIHYHQADYLTQALEDNGFKVLELQRQDYPEQDGTTTIDLIILAEKVIR